MRATQTPSRRCAVGWVSVTSAARTAATWNWTAARSPTRPSTATTTGGSGSTRATTTSSCSSTPITCRCPPWPNACSATSATRKWPSSSAPSSTAPGKPHHPVGGVRPVPLPRRYPAGRQPPPVRNARRHQRGGPDQRHQGRVRRLDHRGHGDELQDPRHQEPDGPGLAVGLHPGPRRGRRGAELVDRLLLPADPLVGGNIRLPDEAGLAGGLQAPARRDAPLRPDADLLPRRSPSDGSSASPSAPLSRGPGSRPSSRARSASWCGSSCTSR
jgi:hypothetical protein